MRFADWVRESAFTAGAIDPAAPLDDLEPLRALVGDARVVAIGESAHHAREFYLLRHRLLRFLVERCGFTVYAFEAPYVESEALDDWVCGGPGELPALTGTPDMSLTRGQDMYDALSWMRAHNATAERPVRFAGTLPGSGGVPELRRVRIWLRGVDPDALPLVDRALDAAGRFHDADPFHTITRYQALDRSVRDAFTADLSRLVARLESMGSPDEILMCLRAAWRIDHMYRDVSGLGLPIGTTSLDAFAAESVLGRLAREPEARIVLALHNVHIRATEVEHDGPRGLFPAGHHLRAALGDGYVAIAATGLRGYVMAGEYDPERADGLSLVRRALPPPDPGSVEAAFAGTVPPGAPSGGAPSGGALGGGVFEGGAALAIADLREADVDDAAGVRLFRSQDEFLETPVFEAFDAVACVPYLRTVDDLGA